MSDMTAILGSAGVGVGIVTAIGSLLYQRRQTLIMATQVDKEIEIKISRDLSDAPGGGPDSNLRAFLNRRLSDVRTQLRQEFSPRLDAIEDQLKELHIADRDRIAAKALQVIAGYQATKDEFDESNNKVIALEQQIQALQGAIEDIRNGVGNHAMVRAQIRGIAEQLLRMTGQELPMQPAPASPYVGGDTSI